MFLKKMYQFLKSCLIKSSQHKFFTATETNDFFPINAINGLSNNTGNKSVFSMYKMNLNSNSNPISNSNPNSNSKSNLNLNFTQGEYNNFKNEADILPQELKVTENGIRPETSVRTDTVTGTESVNEHSESLQQFGVFYLVSLDSLRSKYDDIFKDIYDLLPFNTNEILVLLNPIIDITFKYIYTLPASQNYHHNVVGGLLFHSIETARLGLAYLYREAIGLELLPSKRASLQPAYALAIFIAGLWHDLGKILSDIEVEIHPQNPKIWNPLELSLFDFLVINNANQYKVHHRVGRGKRHEKLGPILVNMMLPKATLNYFLGYPEVLDELYRVLNSDKTSIFFNVIKRADIASTELDMRQNLGNVNDSLLCHNPLYRFVAVLQDYIRNLDHPFNNSKGCIYLVGDKVLLSLNTSQFYALLKPLKEAGVFGGITDVLELYKRLIEIGIGKYAHKATGKIISEIYFQDIDEVSVVKGLLIDKPEYLYAKGSAPMANLELTTELIEAYKEIVSSQNSNELEANSNILLPRKVTLKECLFHIKAKNNLQNNCLFYAKDILDKQNDLENNNNVLYPTSRSNIASKYEYESDIANNLKSYAYLNNKQTCDSSTARRTETNSTEVHSNDLSLGLEIMADDKLVSMALEEANELIGKLNYPQVDSKDSKKSRSSKSKINEQLVIAANGCFMEEIPKSKITDKPKIDRPRDAHGRFIKREKVDTTNNAEVSTSNTKLLDKTSNKKTSSKSRSSSKTKNIKNAQDVKTLTSENPKNSVFVADLDLANDLSLRNVSSGVDINTEQLDISILPSKESSKLDISNVSNATISRDRDITKIISLNQKMLLN